MAKKKSVTKQSMFSVVINRVGDFYEAYDMDAVCVSNRTGVAITTQRSGRRACGFPFHALDSYVKKMLIEPWDCISILYKDGTVCRLVMKENGEIIRLNTNQNNNQNNTTTMDNNQNNAAQAAINPLSFQIYKFSEAYIESAGRYVRCKMVRFIHDYNDGATNYMLQLANEEPIQFTHEELAGRLHEFDGDHISVATIKPTEFYPRVTSLNEKRCVLNDVSSGRPYTYSIVDGILKRVEVSVDRYSDGADGGMLYSKVLTGVECFQSEEDALAYNKVHVVEADGTESVRGGKWSEVVPTSEQQVLVDVFLKALDDLKDAGVTVLYDRDCGDIEFINNNKARVDNFEYNGEEEDEEVLDGWHLKSHKASNIYDYDNCCGEYRVAIKKGQEA